MISVGHDAWAHLVAAQPQTWRAVLQTRDGPLGRSAGHSRVAYSDLAARVTATAPSSLVL